MTGAPCAGAPWAGRSGASDWFARMGAAGGPWGGGPWGVGGGWKPPKARRGDVRLAILGVLAEQALNGYQIIQAIAERSDGRWKPSPGSVYPTLQQLEDEGLVQAAEAEGRRTYHLTAEGRAYVEGNAEQVTATWEAFATPPGGGGGAGDDSGLKPLIGQVAAALWQVVATGSPDQQARARDAVADLRRRLYGILADDEPDAGPGDSGDFGNRWEAS